MESVSSGKSVSANETRGEVAFKQLLPEFQNLPSEQLVAIGVDVKSAVATVLGALAEIRRFSAELPKFAPHLNAAVLGPAVVERLERSAFALNWAHGRYLAAGQPSNDLLAMVEQGVDLRDQLLADASTLARRGLIEPTSLDQVQTASGYKNLAADLTVLSSVLKDAWPRIEGKCAIQFEELERAGALGERIIEAVGVKEQGAPVTASATDMRARAFTDLVERYDDVRRSISYARWKQDDADSIAPSLYAGRRRRSGTDVAPPPVAPVSLQPAPAETSARNAQTNGGGNRSAEITGVPAETEPFVTE